MKECKIEFFLNDQETAEKLFNHCEEMLDNEDLDYSIQVMYKIIKSDVDKFIRNSD
jgi:hypothetical protein